MSTKATDPPQSPKVLFSLLRGSRPARIILLDDESGPRAAITMMLKFYFKDYVTVECVTGDEGWSEISKQCPDLFITDYSHPGMRLEAMFQLLRQNHLKFPIIVASSWVSGTPELQERLISEPELNITLLNKPYLVQDLKTKVITCLNVSTPAQGLESQSSRQRGLSECKPLLEAATKDVFRKNAFRITGLSVDATAREVGKHADKLKMLAELGQDPHSATAALPIKPPPSLDEIREAIQKLKDPEKRLVDEFFWFWPEEFGKSQSDPAIQALARGDLVSPIDIWTGREKSGIDGGVATHNLALVFHVRALDLENALIKSEGTSESRQKIGDFWQGAFKRWERLATDDAFWEKVTERIRQLNEPNLPTGFARRMRATLPEALDKINAELAVEFALAGKMGYAKVHIQFMRETNQGLDNVEKTSELVLTPARNRLKEQIRRAKDRADKNPRDSANAARDLLEQARHTLQLFDLFFDKDSDVRNELFDEVAALCNQLPVAYQKATGDNLPCLEILRAVLPFATSMDLRQQIEENISTLTGNLTFKKLEPVYALLKSVQESQELPRNKLQQFNSRVVDALNAAAAGSSAASEELKELFDSAAIVLRGISLEAWNKHQDKTTAVAASSLAINYAKSSELRSRLREDSATLANIPGKVEQTVKEVGRGCATQIIGYIIIGGVLMLLSAIIGSCK